MAIGFSDPIYLIALACLPVVVWIEWRAWTDLVRWRRRTVLGCRFLEVLLLVLAVAGMRWERARDEVTVLFAIDVSESITQEDRQAAIEKINAAASVMRADDLAGVLTFARKPLVEIIPQAKPVLTSIEARPDPNFTDLAALVRLAAAVYPEGMRRRLVIFSDGNENRGRVLEALPEARAAGITIDVFPIRTGRKAEVSLTRLEVPGRIEKGEPFEVSIEAFASDDAEAKIRLYRDGAPLGSQEVRLKSGRNPFSFTLKEDEPGFHIYEAVIESAYDTRLENNVASAFTRVSGPSKILLVGPERDNASLRNAFELAQIRFEESTTLPGRLSEFQTFDSVILNNISAVDFTSSQIRELNRYVRDLGGGFGMVGGENSFGPGGWIGTPVEEALPVRMELMSKEKFPSLGLIMVIDKSGSMGGYGSGASKMKLANQATVESIRLLGPKDQVGVIAFDSAAKWVAKLGPAGSRAQIIPKVLSIRSGGGTDAYQGARLAYEALAAARLKMKHIILLTDGMTAPANFPELLQKMNAAGITLTTIAIGRDADQPFLKSLASQGKGRYYFCPDPSRMPRIFVRETILVQRSYLIEETAVPMQTGLHPILGDSFASVPPLHGWVATEMKDRAEPVLKIKGDPLLATWNYGLGKSFAFTSDALPRWGKDWVAWEGFSGFWDRAIRWSLRTSQSADLYPQITVDRGQGKLIVEAASESGESLNFLKLKARIIRPDLTVDEVELTQTGIGRYEALFDADDQGAYLAAVFGEAGRRTSAGSMVAYSPEFRDFESNEFVLHELATQTGGKVRPRLDEIFRREGPPVRSAKEITFWLLMIALLLLLIEIGVRRLYFDEEQIAKARAVIDGFMPRGLRLASASAPAPAGVADALKTRSRAVRSRLRRSGGRPLEGETEAGASAEASTEAPASPKVIWTSPEGKPRTDQGGTETATASPESPENEPPPPESPSGTDSAENEGLGGMLGWLKARKRRTSHPVKPKTPEGPNASGKREPDPASLSESVWQLRPPQKSPPLPDPKPEKPSPPPAADSSPEPEGETTSRLLDAKRRKRKSD